MSYIIDIREVRLTHHQNPEFGHTQGEILKKLAKKYIIIQGGVKLRKPSILVVNWVSSLSFIFIVRLHCCYIFFTAPTCTTTIIRTLCIKAFRTELQHFYTEI